MSKKRLVLSIFSLSLTAFMWMANAQNSEVVSIESLLYEMVDREAMAKFPKSNFRLKQESSYNRASTTPEDSIGWFMNHDYNSKDDDHNFIRIEEVNGQKEWVLMDHKGPGAIVRTWMPFLSAEKPDTDIQIKIYLDGGEVPVLEGNMLGLLDGTGLFPFPFAHKSLRSAVSFFPIPYAKSCKITTTKKPFFYQFTYRDYDEHTMVNTFSKHNFKKAETLIHKIGMVLLNPENVQKGKQISFSTILKANKEHSLILPPGNAAIKEINLKLDDYKDPEVMRSVILKIEFDGEQTVWTPIGDFFGNGIGLNPFQGWYRTVAEDGKMTSRWVMPYQKTGKITVVNLGKDAIKVDLIAEVGRWQWDSESLYFNAGWRGQYPVPTRPFSDWNYVTLKGRGVYVGDALTVMNPVEKWWGEGDEKIWVDGEDFPSIFGTGTEDYYGYSWGGRSTDFYEHPFHAQPRSHMYNKLNRKTNDTKNTLGYSIETRTRALDVIPFSSSLQLDMEVWSWTECDMGYAVGVYWYGDKQTTSNRLPDEKEVLNIPQLPKTILKKVN